MLIYEKYHVSENFELFLKWRSFYGMGDFCYNSYYILQLI